ncbi:hypothetical protein [Chitinophaga sp. 212800010-3]|uniref:hypothetical protein n=1 Tax=unclassified Chitinophaga TaxID=2619133 RepID=UPI002DF56EB0|nr:DUF2383 domain-containing protein [Chitinophaga sp. 212800010-3]
MKAASVSDIKKELSTLPPSALSALCLRLARYKLDNKELLSYLLFEAHDPEGYLTTVKEEIDSGFEEMTGDKLYHAKKRLRKILRITNKHIRYMGSKPAEAELLVYFCTKMKESGLLSSYSIQLNNLYDQQLKKIEKVIAGEHEDLQYDYQRQLQELRKK